ncbi:DUF6655 family protein [Azomonas macrocytogenes]|uniref:Lipoprotein n=1 Tax=Azomonas macrocytogenes TaxID=69962 RepID=A0A839T755_AZOMA|nr:DUF6655 family protein [Azomonas macrocytogenes]MBB3104928.1 hypothetical protein [Azomonas macrocytogenes]
MSRFFNLSAALLVPSLLLSLSGCTNLEESNPPRTATEELLISTAAERAARKLKLKLPSGGKVFVDTTNFEGTDSKYTIAAIRSHLLSRGVRLADDKGSADTIVELRADALSTDRINFVVGIPSFNLPMPLSSSPISIPQLALYGEHGQKGVASFAATSYNAKTGAYIDAQQPQFGYSHNNKTTLLFFFSWINNDTIPKNQQD